MNHALRSLPPGSAVQIEGDDGARRGIWHFNPHSLMAARLLDRNPAAIPDAAWFEARLGQALTLRQKLFTRPH
jgi:23S rRNA (cytosine1962-C5)-methyltransferase